MTFAVDASVLIAIFKGEPEEDAFLLALASDASVIGWPTVLEVRIWLIRRGSGKAQQWMSNWLDLAATTIVAFDAELEEVASSAYGRFGKGRHPAALNFGDAMSYAVARHHNMPLLFKGGDFGKTDLRVHKASSIQT